MFHFFSTGLSMVTFTFSTLQEAIKRRNEIISKCNEIFETKSPEGVRIIIEDFGFEISLIIGRAVGVRLYRWGVQGRVNYLPSFKYKAENFEGIELKRDIINMYVRFMKEDDAVTTYHKIVYAINEANIIKKILETIGIPNEDGYVGWGIYIWFVLTDRELYEKWVKIREALGMSMWSLPCLRITEPKMW